MLNAVTPPAPGTFTQHPDDLIKKSDKAKAKPAAAAPTTPDPADEQTLEQLKSNLSSLLFDNKPPTTPASDDKKKADEAAAAKAAEEAKKVEDDKAAAEAAKADEGKKDDEKDKKTRVRKAPDALEIARETGKAIADTLNKTATPNADVIKKDEPAADPTTSLSKEDKENYELFKVLSDTDPRYKNKHEDFLAFTRKLATYKKKWAKENPNAAFDPNDDAHSDFYSENQPQFEETDLDRARIKLEARREVETQTKAMREEHEKKLREIEEKAVGPEVARQAAAKADSAVSMFVEAIPDAAIKETLVKDSNKLKETDPVAFDILNSEAGILKNTVVELHNIIHKPNYFNSRNPLHADLANYIDRQEQYIKTLPATQQRFENRNFATREEWASMPADQRKQHWILSEDDVVGMLTTGSAKRAVQLVENERQRVAKMAEKYGYVKAAASGATQTPPNKSAPSAGGTVKKPVAPSGVDGGPTPPTNTPSKTNSEGVEKQLVSLLF